MSVEEHGQQLALAQFDGNPAGSVPMHDAFDLSSTDWETTLVHMLDGMYMYSHATAASTAANAHAFYGSARSVAVWLPHHRTKGIEISNLIEAEFKAERTLEPSPACMHALELPEG
uniref:Uncharacterized protein n=1 Tax=Oryza meridionalis TaxID=40149 RepID=A0A0E0DQU1_9ORYZ